MKSSLPKGPFKKTQKQKVKRSKESLLPSYQGVTLSDIKIFKSNDEELVNYHSETHSEPSENFSHSSSKSDSDQIKVFWSDKNDSFDANIPSLIKSISLIKRSVLIGIVVFFVFGIGIAGAQKADLIGKISSLERRGLNSFFSKVLPPSDSKTKVLSLLSTPFPSKEKESNLLLTSSSSKTQAVLAAETIKPLYSLNVRIPSVFYENLNLKKDLTVEGTMTLNNDLVFKGQKLDLGAASITGDNFFQGVTAGTGISVGSGNNPTITNTDPGSSQKIFKTIKVGSTTFDAGSNTDTITFTAGTGISLSADTSNKKVTITSSATTDLTSAGGWTDGGTAIYPATLTDKIGIGTSSPGSNLEVAGTVQLRGATGTTGLYVDAAGNVGIGTTSPSNLLDANGKLVVASGGNVGIGTTNPLATLDLRNTSGTAPTASISGNSSFAGLVIDNSGSGDLFTASSSGLNRFVIKQDGNIGIGVINPSALLNVGSNFNVTSNGAVTGISFTDGTATLTTGALSALSSAAFGTGNLNLTGTTIGLSTDTDLISLAANALTINGTLSSTGALSGSTVTDGTTTFSDTTWTSTSGLSWDLGASTTALNIESGLLNLDTTNSRVGIGTTSPLANLDIRGNLGTMPAASVSANSSFTAMVIDNKGLGDILAASSSGLNRFVVKQSGNVGIGTTTPSSTLYVAGDTIIAPSAGSSTALTLRAAPSGSANIFNITSNDGNTSYFSINSSGQLSGNAFRLTDVNNTIVGTAIEGGHTMNSNTYTYRRQITIVNNSGSTLPANYQISIALGSADSSQVYTNTQSDGDDFRVAYNNSGTISDIARNLSSYTSSDVTFTFQLQAAITTGSTNTSYFIYYKNSSLSAPSTYTGNVAIDSLDSSASSWSSTDSAQFVVSQTTPTPTPSEGTGSLRLLATVDNIGTFSATSQNVLPAARTNFGSIATAISGTTYAYVVGGSSDGATSSAQTTVYRSSINSSTGNVGSWSTDSPTTTAVSDTTVSVATPPFDTGNGTLPLDLNPSNNTCLSTVSAELSWNAGSSTCTITTGGSAKTLNFTWVNIPSGTTLTTDGPKTTSDFVTIKATQYVNVAGTINLNEKGYSGGSNGGHPGGYGPGAGGYNTYSDFAGGGGGAFGGDGGRGGKHVGYTPSEYAAGGIAYDTEDSGSGGGAGENSNFYAAGGAGGGGIKITSGANITISGTITSNGATGSVNMGISGGGGSGGKVHLQGTNVTVSGSITANGGGGGADGNNVGGGGGGGGRITLEYSGSLTGSVAAPSGGSRGGTGYSAANGSSGASTSPTASPTMYILGGKNTSGSAISTIYQATMDSSNGSVGAFFASSSAIPQALYGHTSNAVTVGTTNYVYIIGGNTGSTDSTTVYKGSFSGANINSYDTASQTQLTGNGLSYHSSVTASIGGTNYIYLIGGRSNYSVKDTVYKGTINGSDGDIDALTTSGQGTLPQPLYSTSAFIATVGSTNYLYVVGGIGSDGNRKNTIYRATIDGSGNVGSFSATGQIPLTNAISGHALFKFTDSASNQFAYMVGGNTGTAQTAVLRAKYFPVDQTSYNLERSITSTNLSNKNHIQFKVFNPSTGGRTGSFIKMDYYDSSGGWQTCANTGDFNASSEMNLAAENQDTWDTIACDISNATKAAITKLRFIVTSSSTSQWNIYVDDIQGVMNSATIANTSTGGSAVLGAANISLNGQGTGSVMLNYDPGSGQAGSGGMRVYDGAAGLLFNLTATGDASAAGALTLTGASASANFNILGGQNLTFRTSVGGDGGLSAKMTLLNNGNLGIGTTSPSYKLDLTTSTANDRGINIANTAATGTNYGVYSSVTGASTANYGGYFVSTGATTNYGIAVAALTGATSTGLDIGNLSGGTANKGINIGTISGTGTGAGLTIEAISSTGATNYGINIGAISGAGTTNYGLYLEAVSGATTNYSIYSNGGTNYFAGNVGVGTTSPLAALDIRSSSGTAPTASISANSSFAGLIVDNSGSGDIFSASSSGLNRFVIKQDGNVGIGDNTPSYQLELSLDSAAKPGTNTWTVPSDSRLKNIIGEYTYGLSEILRLNTIRYTFREDNALGIQDRNAHIGIIAQEVQSIIPDAVSTGPDGYLRFSADPVIWASINAIKELASQGASLQNEVASISSTLSQNNERLEQLNSEFPSLISRISTLETQLSSFSAILGSSSSASLYSVLLNSIQDLGSVLGASTSADLSTLSSQLSINSATISGDLMVLGRTTVSDLGVTGSLTAGVLSINGMTDNGDAEINTLGGTLKLQSNGLNGIDIMAGKITIDTSGNIMTTGEITAKKFNVDTSDNTSASLGSSTIIEGQRSVLVLTSAITSRSKVFVTATTPTGKQELIVSRKTEGQGFTVTIEDPYSEDIDFDWWIIDSR